MSRLIVAVISVGFVTLFVVYVIGLGFVYALPLAILAAVPTTKEE